MRSSWLARVALVGGLAIGQAVAAGSARAEELPDKQVKWLMDYAAAGIVTKYTGQDGKVILIDRSKPEEFEIPIEDARQVVKVAYNTARAQICHLKDKEDANVEALLKHVAAAKKWSDKQVLYIRQLQLFVVQITVGSVTIRQVDDQNHVLQVLPAPDNLKKPKPCTPEEAKDLSDKIDAYVKEVAN
jgi:hypothetical protein